MLPHTVLDFPDVYQQSHMSWQLASSVFPQLCPAAHWSAAENAEGCHESFMFWQNLLFVTSLTLHSLWRV